LKWQKSKLTKFEFVKLIGLKICSVINLSNMKIFLLCIAMAVIIFTACQTTSTDTRMGVVGTYNEQNANISPGDWHFASQRDEVVPVHSVNNNVKFRGNPTLAISGGGKEHANGCWYTNVAIDPERYYQFRAYYRATQVEQPWRSVLARVIWFDENNKQVGPAEYPRTLHHQSPENWDIIEQVFKSPPQARNAKLELVYRWDHDGEVYFGECSFVEVDEMPSRKVNLATIHHRPRNSKGPEDNLEQFAKYIADAGNQGADIICLPEGMTMVGTGLNYISAAEPIPGPSTRFLGEIAKKHSLYLVAGLLESDGDVVYNTAVLIDRNGELAGKYRKVSLPREEIDGGITPGDDLPVFDTDFGRVGIMICWDVSFPEVARALALRGAEVILMPIWGGNITLTQARAIENQVYLVTSTYNMKSAIFDLEGNVLEEATENNPVVVAEVDLDQQMLWPWLGDFKNRIPREIPSKTSYEQREGHWF
jgi:predicted amidohydrolase